MLSAVERDYLKSPENFNTDYSYVIRHRLKGKVRELQTEIELLQKGGFLNLTEFSKITDFSKMQQTPNQSAFDKREWAEPCLNPNGFKP